MQNAGFKLQDLILSCRHKNSKNPRNSNRVVQEWPNLADTYAAHLNPPPCSAAQVVI